MKNKLLIFLLTIIILAIIFFIAKFYIDKSILKNEEKQVVILKEMYSDFIKKCPYYITFDKSALRNIITKENFSEENIRELRSINNTRNVIETDSVTAIITSSYNKKTKTITLKLKTLRNNSLSQVQNQSYNLFIEEFKIKFIPHKIGNNIFFDHTN